MELGGQLVPLRSRPERRVAAFVIARRSVPETVTSGHQSDGWSPYYVLTCQAKLHITTVSTVCVTAFRITTSDDLEIVASPIHKLEPPGEDMGTIDQGVPLNSAPMEVGMRNNPWSFDAAHS
jgi:hypothetical protein